MSKSCFVIAPLGNSGSEVRQRSDDLLDLVIRPAVEPLGYSVLRVDQLSRPGIITQDILSLLIEADLVIADLSDANPNVMYELGVRHSVGRPVILITSEGNRVPFDVAGFRFLEYKLSNPREIQHIRDNLGEYVRAIEINDKADSPIISAQAYKEFFTSSPSAHLPAAVKQEAVLTAIVERLGSLEAKLDEYTSSAGASEPSPRYTRDVFIVHGHDGELKNELARLLEKLEFVPIILHEQADKGQTIIQKLQYESSRVGFAFILHTPDDEGRKVGASSELNPRSRQNVVFEHGMFVGRFTHGRVCAIVRHGVEIPSDLSGVVYKTIPVGGSIQSIAYDVVKELRAAGYVIDANKL